MEGYLYVLIYGYFIDRGSEHLQILVSTAGGGGGGGF